jgi:hypothetical protein
MEPYFRSLKLELTHLLAGWPKTEALKGQRNINLKKAFEARHSRPTMTRALNRTSFCIAHLVVEAITLSVIAKRIICGRWQHRFVEGEKTKFDVRLN